MSAPNEDLRDIFAVISALGFIMRGVPNEDVPKEAYAMADLLIKERNVEVAVGLPVIRKRKSK